MDTMTPTLTAELDALVELERTLRFDIWNSEMAMRIGTHIWEQARQGGKTVEIDIEFDGHIVFRYAMTGWKPEFERWIAGKKIAAKTWGMASLRVFLLLEQEGRTFAEKHPEHAALNNAVGGCFPIRLRGDETIRGWVSVTGLPHRDDHAMVVDGIRSVL